LALVGSFELLMLLIGSHHKPGTGDSVDVISHHQPQAVEQDEPAAAPPTVTLEQTVHAWHGEGRSQRAIARELNIDRRKVRQIIDRTAAQKAEQESLPQASSGAVLQSYPPVRVLCP
jgi:hypothetical protein